MQSTPFDHDTQGQKDSSPPARSQSGLVQNFPWYHTAILSVTEISKLVPSGHEGEKFLYAVETAEKVVPWTSLLSPISYQSKVVSDLVANVMPLNLQPRAEKQHRDLECSILACYRLSELLIPKSTEEPSQPPLCKKQSYLGSNYNQHWGNALYNWPESIRKFSETVQTLKENQIPTGLAGLDVHFLLSDRLGCLKVISNVNFTVLYLRYLLKGNIAYRGGAAAIIEMDSSAPEALVNMFLNTYDDKAIKGPLEECLLISPLLIFSTSQRSKSKWKRLDLIEVAKRLGNEKPAGLMEIEEIIWGVLQKMAQGEYTLLEGCKALANVLSLSTSTSAIQGHDYFHSSGVGQPLAEDIPIAHEIVPQSWPSMVDGHNDPQDYYEDRTMVGDNSSDTHAAIFRSSSFCKSSHTAPLVTLAPSDLEGPRSPFSFDLDVVVSPRKPPPTYAWPFDEDYQGALPGSAPDVDPQLCRASSSGANSSDDENTEADADADAAIQDETNAEEDESSEPDASAEAEVEAEAEAGIALGVNARSDVEADAQPRKGRAGAAADADEGVDKDMDAGGDSRGGPSTAVVLASPVSPKALPSESTNGSDMDLGSDTPPLNSFSGAADVSDEEVGASNTNQGKNSRGCELPKAALPAAANPTTRPRNRATRSQVHKVRVPQGAPSSRRVAKRARTDDDDSDPEIDTESNDEPLGDALNSASSRTKKKRRLLSNFGNNQESPIDVELLLALEPKVNLDDKEALASILLHTAPEAFQIFDPAGNPHVIQQIYHHEPSRKAFLSFFTTANNFSEGTAVHQSSPDKSAFHVLTEVEYNQQEPLRILELLRRKHIVVRDCSFPTYDFDEAGLSSLSRLDRVVEVQDHSAPLVEGLHTSECLRHATLMNVLEAAEGKARKILNALSFPMPQVGFLRNNFASESAAWYHTEGIPMCKPEDGPFPVQDVQWGLAGTAGALHGGHIDSDGFGTYVDVVAGSKVWIVGHPKDPNHTNVPFANPDLFKSFDGSVANGEQWNLHAIFLPAGTRLIMRPNTPHFVYTPEHAICHGGHFYAITTMQDTLAGAIHDLAHHRLITNTEHSPSRTLLIRLGLLLHKHFVHSPIHEKSIGAHHIPSLETFSSVLDFFSTINLSTMSEIFDWDTYTPHGVMPRTKIRYQHARGAGYETLEFFFKSYLIRDAAGTLVNAIKEIYAPLLTALLKAIISTKRSARASDGIIGCTLFTLKREISKWIATNPYFILTLDQALEQDLAASPAWSGSMDYTIHKNPETLAFTPKTPEELVEMGKSSLGGGCL